MKTILRSLIFLMYAIAVLLWPLSAIAADSQTRATVVAQQSTATLTFLTALPGETLARIAAGQTVMLGSLPDDSRAKILVAAKTAIGPSYDNSFSKHIDLNEFALMIFSDFTVTFRGGALGSESDISIQLIRDFLKIYNIPADGVVAYVPTLPMPNPPTLDSIMLAAPSDTLERANFLRAKSLELLYPVGTYRLKKAGIPVALSRFTSPQPIKLSALSDSEKTWLAGIYREFCLHAIEVGEKIKSAKSEGKITVDGVPSEWLNKYPPAWSELGDVSIEFAAQYMPVIAPVGKPNSEEGGGWSLPKYGVVIAK